MAGEANVENSVELDTVEDELDLPIVIQCGSCFVILGDSTAWVCANEALKTISLERVCPSVITKNDLCTSRGGEDLGSTFMELVCTECKHVVGKQYKTTSRNLDIMRDIFTFEVDKIVSYQVGTADKGASIELTDEILTLSSINTIRVELRKSQSLIVTLHHRIEALEKRFSMDIERGQEKEHGNRPMPQTQPKLTVESLSQPHQEEPRTPKRAKGGVREGSKNVSGSTENTLPSMKSTAVTHPLRKKRKI
ncbi:uncharacterized protein LOC135474227 [Liolophura sinensis]|uniref:uncharacterized protein LOC135474227 n=1 Tax=Liolophura sinensis TaxID=3198878 RepID=UPI0031595FC0